MALMRGASLGAYLRGLYATRSRIAPKMEEMIMATRKAAINERAG